MESILFYINAQIRCIKCISPTNWFSLYRIVILFILMGMWSCMPPGMCGGLLPFFTSLRQSALLFLPHCVPQHTCSFLFSVVLGIRPRLCAYHVSTLPLNYFSPNCTHFERNIKVILRYYLFSLIILKIMEPSIFSAPFVLGRWINAWL